MSARSRTFCSFSEFLEFDTPPFRGPLLMEWSSTKELTRTKVEFSNKCMSVCDSICVCVAKLFCVAGSSVVPWLATESA